MYKLRSRKTLLNIEKQAEQADAFVFAKAAFSQQLDNMEFFNKADDGIGK